MLGYKPAGSEFDSLWCDWNSSLTEFFWPQYGPDFDSASNITELSTGIFCRVKRRPDLRADNLATLRKIWEIQPLATLRVCPGL
jgi:hypothetical protein